MKNLKVSLSAMALILGIGSAMATSAPHRFATKTWGRLSATSYVDVTNQTEGTDYDCSGTSGICTATYQDNVNPNSTPNATPLSTVPGTFHN